MGVYYDKGKYNLKEDLVISMPCRCLKGFNYEIVDDLKMDQFCFNKFQETVEDLLSEKSLLPEFLDD